MFSVWSLLRRLCHTDWTFNETWWGWGAGGGKAKEEPVPVLEQNNAAFLIIDRINVALLCATSMMSI